MRIQNKRVGASYTGSHNLRIESIKELNTGERTLVAHCLIASLEIVHDEDVERAWLNLAEKRFSELESGAVKGVSWKTLKKDIKS